jgi:hypothetical protein
VSQCLQFANITIRQWKHGFKKEEKKKRKMKNEKQKEKKKEERNL